MDNFINILDHSKEELHSLLDRCITLKKRMKQGIPDRILLGKTLMTIFEKPSTRTRVSLEAAASSMGANSMTQEMTEKSRLGKREAIKDVARVVCRYVDIIAIRTFEHENVEEFANYSDVPVINALSDYSHPTQAMADILTAKEHLGEIKGKKIVFIGDGNNVAYSLAAAAGKFDMAFSLIAPEGYEFSPESIDFLKSKNPDSTINVTNNIDSDITDADIIYTDVWTSMGQEDEYEKRMQTFKPYQVNEELLSKAPKHCKVMHCLPAHRDEEITDGVIESKQSIVFDQAENRMHLYRGLFGELLKK
ncbi:MAG: ornithine carbamoyltransferase [Planctomycetota bacterium]|jgi:ornithine carbamoyltransferase